MAADASLTWDQVLAWRLAQQGLRPGRAAPADAVALVGHLAGVQTQVEASAAQVLAVRGVKNVDLDALLWQDRALLKTWAMRGTLHLLPAAEWRTWIAVMRTREWRITPGWERYHGISKAELEAVTDGDPRGAGRRPADPRRAGRPHRRQLTGARPPGRGAAVGVGAGLQARRQPGPAVPGPAAGEGHDVHVTRGVARRRDRATAAAEPDPDEAAATVLARFLDVNGPATRDDLARWLGVTPKEARVLLAAHADGLVEVDVDGFAGLDDPGRGAGAAAEAGAPEGVLLLPGFDPWVLAPISHRAHTIPDGRVDDVSRKAGWISPVAAGRRAGGRHVGARSSTPASPQSPSRPFGRCRSEW